MGTFYHRERAILFDEKGSIVLQVLLSVKQKFIEQPPENSTLFENLGPHATFEKIGLAPTHNPDTPDHQTAIQTTRRTGNSAETTPDTAHAATALLCSGDACCAWGYSIATLKVPMSVRMRGAPAGRIAA